MNPNSVMSMYSVKPAQTKQAQSEYIFNSVNKNGINFTANVTNTNISTSLTTKEEKEKYKTLTQKLDKNDRKLLDYTLKTGILLNNNSNNKSTVLDNLYNIATKPRAEGLENKKILKDTLTSITNPYTITQKFGDIPEEYKEEVINNLTNNSTSLIDKKSAEMQIKDLFSGCCVAADSSYIVAWNETARPLVLFYRDADCC